MQVEILFSTAYVHDLEHDNCILIPEVLYKLLFCSKPPISYHIITRTLTYKLTRVWQLNIVISVCKTPLNGILYILFKETQQDPARESRMFFMSYGARTGPVWDQQGCRTVPLRTRKGIDATRICKNPTRASYMTVRAPCGHTRAVHGLFMISRSVRARKLIMHASKLHGSRTGRLNCTAPHGSRTGPVSERAIFVQNSPGTALTGPGVM